MIVDRIVETKREEVRELYRSVSTQTLLNQCKECGPVRNFHDALIQGVNRLPAGISLIAEVKKASPSKGVIRTDFDPVKIAETYEGAGAAAISVLTDVTYFQGSSEYLQKVRSHVTLPLLRKDFIVDEVQIPQTRLLGADAILLIVSILEQPQLEEFLSFSKELGLTPLVEVHDEREAERALRAGAALMGVNNRNLKDFSVDLRTTARVSQVIPSTVTLVAESGIGNLKDVEQVKQSGATAILVGESLVKQPDIKNAVHRLMGVSD